MATRARVLMLALIGAVWAAGAAAQIPDAPYVADEGRLTLGGELSVTTSPSDSTAFFNYTDYDHNALRTVRGRLLGQWQPASQLALLGELRFEREWSLDSGNTLEAAALYLRWHPWLHRSFDIQAGRIPPVIGAFVRHAYGRDNLVIGTPLAYQYLTSLRSDALPATADDVLRMRARGWQPTFPIGSQDKGSGLPLITAFHWDTGVEGHWTGGRLDLAGALTRGAPSVAVLGGRHDAPQVSGRLAVTAAPGLTLGFSAARGHWIGSSVLSKIPEASRGENAQSVVGTDFEYGIGRVLVRGEWLRSAFEVPRLESPAIGAPLVARSGFLEGRYRLRPRWQVSGRAERLTFSDITGTLDKGAETPWDAPVTRVEAVIGYRAARNLEVRAGWQQNWRDAGRVLKQGYPVLQVLYWF
jgi:hypothetical protein